MKLTKEQEQEIVKYAFYEELEKVGFGAGVAKVLAKIAPKLTKSLGLGSKSIDTASKFNWGFKNLGKFKDEATAAFGQSGKKGFDYIKSHAKSEIVRDGKKLTKAKFSKGQVGATSGVTQRILGTIARESEFLGKGLSRNQSIFKNIGQMGKNVSSDVKRQLTSARFKDFSKSGIGAQKNKNFKFTGPKDAKGRHTVLTRKSGKYFKNRKIVGWTAKGDPITKKRGVAALGAMTMTPVGFAAQGALMDSPESGLKDYATWKVPSIGVTKELFEAVVSPGE